MEINDFDIYKLEKDVDMQTRNGREDVYLLISDIQELEKKVIGKTTLENNYGEERIYIKANYIYDLIYKYKRQSKNIFKEKLKVDPKDIEPTIVTNIKTIINEKERGE